jgi:3'(2'), 5'-bisphosphate nucleotidase
LTGSRDTEKLILVVVDELWQRLTPEVIALIATFRVRLDSLAVSSKADHTLLTEADIAVQNLIIQRIREFDPSSLIIAEEEHHTSHHDGKRSANVWIVDPIDGTAQFVEPEAVEFCSVIALYRDGYPCAALVIAPELGPDRTPVVVSTDDMTKIMSVNGKAAQALPRGLTGHASTTRSRNSPPGPIELQLLARQYKLKTRTTSQTLDMVRTALDLGDFAVDTPTFDLFHRREQKLWDGAAGIVLASVSGLAITDEDGRDLLPLPLELLTDPTPVLPSTLVGEPALVQELARGADDR